MKHSKYIIITLLICLYYNPYMIYKVGQKKIPNTKKKILLIFLTFVSILFSIIGLASPKEDLLTNILRSIVIIIYCAIVLFVFYKGIKK